MDKSSTTASSVVCACCKQTNMEALTVTIASNLSQSPEVDVNFSGMGDSVFENPFNHTPVRVTFILLYSVVFAMCFLGNIVVLIVFAYSKRMRTRTNVFLANLAVADFCVGVFCVLPNLSINLSPFWNLGPVMCKLFYFVNHLAYTASVLLLVVIAVERYIAIMHPLRCRAYFTAPRLLAAQVVVWVIAAVYNIPILLMFDTTDTGLGVFCYITLPLLNLKTYYTAHFALWYVLPLTVILVMYGRISCTLWATTTTATTTTTTMPVSRSESRASVSLAVTLDTHQHGLPQHHKHHASGSCTVSKCYVSSQTGRTCLSYCDTGGDNCFGSVLTVGLLSSSNEAGRRGGCDGSGGGGGGGCDNREIRRGVFSSKKRQSEGEEGGTAGGVRCAGRTLDLDCGTRRLLGGPPRELDGHMEMVTINGCSDCFSCVQGHTGPRPSPVSCGTTLDVHLAATASTNTAASSSSSCSWRFTNRHLNIDDYAIELSDMATGDDYDSYQSRWEGSGRLASGSSPGRGSSFYGGGRGSLASRDGSLSPTPRRQRTQCRISSQRGLTSRRRVIRLLVAVVTVFALCVLPFHVRNLLHYWGVEITGQVLDFLSPVASVMMYLNCGLNPFVYWMCSDHFRRSLTETMCFWKRSRKSSSRLMLHSPRRNKTCTLKNYDAM